MKSIIPKHKNNVNHTNTRKSSSASYTGSPIKTKTTSTNKTKIKTNIKMNKNNKKLQSHNNNKNNKKRVKQSAIGGFGKNKSAGQSAKSKSHGQSSVSSRRKNGPKPVAINRQRNNNKLSSIKNKSFKNDQEEKDDSHENEPKRKNFAAQMMAIERIHPSSIKLAIDGPHTDQTNPGFSRKIDGTFYGI